MLNAFADFLIIVLLKSANLIIWLQVEAEFQT